MCLNPFKVYARPTERMALSHTRYEVVFYADGCSFRLGFTAKKTRGELLRYARKHGEFIMKNSEPAHLNEEWTYSPNTGVVFGPFCRVAFSGRTERDCAFEDEKARR